MRQLVEFPVEDETFAWGRSEVTFETLAIPPRPDLVTSVFGWVFHGEELLLIRRGHGSWELPGARRRRGETFRETLERAVWEDAGALLSDARLLGGVRTLCFKDTTGSSGPTSPLRYHLCFVATVRELLPFSREFNADDRMLIEPGLVPTLVKPWSALKDEILAYMQAVRVPSLTRSMAWIW